MFKVPAKMFRTVLFPAMALSLVTGLAGCGSGVELPSLGGGSDSGGGGSDKPGIMADITTSGKGPIQVDPSEFVAQPYCPRMELRQDTYLIAKYERGKEDDPRALLYQAYIDKWADQCTRENGQIRIKIGLAGRVTPGPVWKGGEIILPIRVAIVPNTDEDPKPLVSEILAVPVTVGEGSPSEGWTLVEDKYLVPADTSLKVYFGFDEGKKR